MINVDDDVLVIDISMAKLTKTRETCAEILQMCFDLIGIHRLVGRTFQSI
jgi:hypothetical protein